MNISEPLIRAVFLKKLAFFFPEMMKSRKADRKIFIVSPYSNLNDKFSPLFVFPFHKIITTKCRFLNLIILSRLAHFVGIIFAYNNK